ncbi:MAG: hypothetical protein JWO06_552 [Bacteroidota bacterium]|nr:hypothetical protein [Bacteroidota bacterium]
MKHLSKKGNWELLLQVEMIINTEDGPKGISFPGAS